MFDLLVALAAILAATIASIAGFGVGSILTPLLAAQYGTKLAVAVVSVPHLLATTFRFWLIRQHVDRHVLLTFGITSAAGGLAGALLHTRFKSPVLAFLLGGLLVFAGSMELFGLAPRLRFGHRSAWVAGAVSGAFGGLVGNQGGLRAAALLAFDAPRTAFVATATAIGMLVDAARMPVYAVAEGSEMLDMWPIIAWASAGALVGTVTGERVLRRIPETIFRRIVGGVILALGIAMFILPQA